MIDNRCCRSYLLLLLALCGLGSQGHKLATAVVGLVERCATGDAAVLSYGSLRLSVLL